MANVDELTNVVKDTLVNRGVLGQLKARIRAEVYKALDNQEVPKPKLPAENVLINELIREYLEYNNYKYTESVLIAESDQPQKSLGRSFVMDELNIAQDMLEPSGRMPLLYNIISYFMKVKPFHEHSTDEGVLGNRQNAYKILGGQTRDETSSDLHSFSRLGPSTISNNN
ncbi:LisH domain-containing protein FOPNL [Trichoplax sp. H2]|uniref:Centrosomal protein 20 n=1 Tax=Trichoplax adhaerens TaxID=10228 RepID=B3RHZ0_TRIAD|nr:expressed hypothetical protein [Trichoplax adhaerens]EDV28946.1 expressed hypothetical protein [Trichoplax adhaerens]RDD39802.1 LisH domain-containing protein FOPNL [Trichoplax sp. H2]|eukprot:XP_002108148.1 expressed hypothetical protein [Trichoplax adhaerens]